MGQRRWAVCVAMGLLLALGLAVGRSPPFASSGTSLLCSLEALTKTLGHGVLISDATRQRAGSWPLHSVGLPSIRGRARELELFALT